MGNAHNHFPFPRILPFNKISIAHNPLITSNKRSSGLRMGTTIPKQHGFLALPLSLGTEFNYPSLVTCPRSNFSSSLSGVRRNYCVAWTGEWEGRHANQYRRINFPLISLNFAPILMVSLSFAPILMVLSTSH